MPMRHKKFPPCCAAGREHLTEYFVFSTVYLTGDTSNRSGGLARDLLFFGANRSIDLLNGKLFSYLLQKRNNIFCNIHNLKSADHVIYFYYKDMKGEMCYGDPVFTRRLCAVAALSPERAAQSEHIQRISRTENQRAYALFQLRGSILKIWKGEGK